MDKDGVSRRCINPSEVQDILEGCHTDPCGGHFVGEAIARKALLAGYWWPSLFKDAHEFTRKCDPCQRVGKPTPTMAMPLAYITKLYTSYGYALHVLGVLEVWRTLKNLFESRGNARRLLLKSRLHALRLEEGGSVSDMLKEVR